MKRMLLGNEAVALGAYMANVTVATGYPGTPSTEILERFARYPGRLRRVVAQREGGAGGGRRRVTGRRACHGDHEARGPQRGRRPLLRRRLHGRGGRAGRRLGRRPRHALLAGRAGQSQLRQVRQGAAAGTVQQPGMRGHDAHRAGDQRAVRHAGASAHDHARLARAVAGGCGRRADPAPCQAHPPRPFHRHPEKYRHVAVERAQCSAWRWRRGWRGCRSTSKPRR